MKALRWSEEESKEAGRALAGLDESSPAMRGFGDGPSRRSGMYVRYNAEPGGSLLERAWADCAEGINRMMDVYGAGKSSALSRNRCDQLRCGIHGLEA